MDEEPITSGPGPGGGDAGREEAPAPAGHGNGPGPADPAADAKDVPDGPEGPPSPSDRREALGRKFDEARRRRQRRARAARYLLFLVLVTVVSAFVAHDILYRHFREVYWNQPWLEIWDTYQRLDKNLILEVHHKRVKRRMDRKWLGKEAYFVGLFSGTRTGEDGRVEIHVDVPIYREVFNMYENDVIYLLPPGAGPPAWEKGQTVVGRGRVLTFSRFLLKVEADEIRKANALETYFYDEWTANLALDRKPIGVKALLEERE